MRTLLPEIPKPRPGMSVSLPRGGRTTTGRNGQIFAGVSESISKALELIEDCGLTYRLVDDRYKKMLNQAIFSKLWVGEDGNVTAEFREPFNMLIDPIKGEIAHYNKEKARGAEALTDIFSVIANRISHFFGHGLNNDNLVETTGLEPVASCV